MAYVRTVKTASGATAVQIVWSSRGGSRKIEHLGSAHDEVGVAALKAAGVQKIAAGQDQLDLGLDAPVDAEPLPITSSRAQHLWGALSSVYDELGFDAAAGGDEVFRQLVAARIIEPTSKVDSLRGDRGSRNHPGDLPNIESPAPGVRQTCFPAWHFEGMRRSCATGPYQPCVVRRLDFIFRD
jgi:hypothetical protein